MYNAVFRGTDQARMVYRAVRTTLNAVGSEYQTQFKINTKTLSGPNETLGTLERITKKMGVKYKVQVRKY